MLPLEHRDQFVEPLIRGAHVHGRSRRRRHGRPGVELLLELLLAVWQQPVLGRRATAWPALRLPFGDGSAQLSIDRLYAGGDSLLVIQRPRPHDSNDSLTTAVESRRSVCALCRRRDEVHVGAVVAEDAALPSGRPCPAGTAHRGERLSGLDRVARGAIGIAAGTRPPNSDSGTAITAASVVSLSTRRIVCPANGADWCPCCQNSHLTALSLATCAAVRM